MRIGKIEVKRRVWIGLGFAVVATVGWWAWTRARAQAMSVALRVPSPFVRLTSTGDAAGDQILRERAQLFDPTPLFFPTEWNFGQRSLPESVRRQPGQVFGSFEANFVFGEQSIKAYGTETTPVPERLADVLVQGNEAPFAGMGQIDMPRPALNERSSFLEVRGFSDSKTIVAQELTGLNLQRLDFAPVEFMVVVSSAGIVGDPILMSGSGWEEVDTFFRSYLVKTFRLGERVNPGRYRVLVGP